MGSDGKGERGWICEVCSSGVFYQHVPIFYPSSRSIGISNFNEDQINTLLAHAKVKPAVNQVRFLSELFQSRMLITPTIQILFHPYVYERQLPILDVASKHGIIIEAYSLLM